jgi:hypothetical protein
MEHWARRRSGASLISSLVLDPNSHARFKVCRLSLRIEAQAKRVAVMIPNDPLGLPGHLQGAGPDRLSQAAVRTTGFRSAKVIGEGGGQALQI